MRKPDEHYIMYVIFSREITFLIFLDQDQIILKRIIRNKILKN